MISVAHLEAVTDSDPIRRVTHEAYAFDGQLTIVQAGERRDGRGWVVCGTQVEYVPGIDGGLVELEGAPAWHGEVALPNVPLGAEIIVATPRCAGHARVRSASALAASFVGVTPLRPHDTTRSC